MEDPVICVLGIAKGNGSVIMVGYADKNDGGGSAEGIFSLLSGSLAIAQSVVYVRNERKHDGCHLIMFAYHSL